MKTLESDKLNELAKKYGTPVFVYSEEAILRQFEKLSSAVSYLNPLICYAMKASSTLGILRIFASLGCGFDVVSGGEILRVKRAGGDTTKIVFSGVGKTADEITLALKERIRFFNVESSSELRKIAEVASKLGVRAPVCFRINPDVDAKTHKHLTTGTKANKFGLSVQSALTAFGELKDSKSVEFVGIDCHIGSQITEVGPLKRAYQAVRQIADEFKSHGMNIRYLDLGGGFGVPYSGHYPELDLAELKLAIEETLDPKQYNYVFEPGRYLVASAAVLLTRLLYLKESSGKHFAIVDAGMNDMVRPAMYDAYHGIRPVSTDAADRAVKSGTRVYDIVGPVCESSCYFAKERELPVLREGDLICIDDVGAYGFSMGSNYMTRPRPPEVLVRSDGSDVVMRRREDYEQLWALEA